VTELTGRSDVLVVGAGPTGCAAGIVLARAGIDVTVIDRARFPRDKTCGDAISNDGMGLVGELGARDPVEAGPHALVWRSEAVLPDGTRIGRDYERPGYIVERRHFDDALRVALERSGARLVQGARVSALVREGARVVGAEGPGLSWSAPVVIAADGYGSVGLGALGCSKPQGRYLGVSATAYYRNVAFPFGKSTSDHYFDREIPFGYGWIFPAVDGVSNVGVYLRADAYAKLGQNLGAMLEAFLDRKRDRLRGAERVGKPRAWSLPLAPRPIATSGPGLLLAGDAAGLIDPLSGEGIWQGIHSGMLAGRAAATAARAGELTAAIRQEYESACRRDIARRSRAKGWVQEAMAVIVERRLYRSRLVRGALAWGFERRALEMTKS
jgi:menaquinone-9 beta-reductase